MRITERRLRSLLRSLIKEVIEDPKYGTLYYMPDGSVMPAGDQAAAYDQDSEIDEFPRPEDEEDFEEEVGGAEYDIDRQQYMDDWARQNPYMGDED